MFGRLGFILKAMFSKILDRAEDPNVTLDYSYEKLNELLIDVKRGIANVVTAKKQLQYTSEKLERQVVTLESQARDAVAQDRDDLATQALEHKQSIMVQLQDLDVQIKDLEAKQAKLVEQEKELADRISRFKTNKEIMKAQYSAAKANVEIGEAVTGIGSHMQDVGRAIQRAQDKTEQMNARADAMQELVDTGVLDDALDAGKSPLERELAKTSKTQAVQTELAALKAELGGGAKEVEGATEAKS